LQLNPRILLLTFTGGVLGTWARWIFAAFFDTYGTLFVVNILGSLLLGFVNVHPKFQSDQRKAFWAIGLCGGFTTMSAVALWLFQSQNVIYIAIPQVVIMFAAGIAAYFAGTKLVRK
jgi:fluoride ion exporter CrcB/FEX